MEQRRPREEQRAALAQFQRRHRRHRAGSIAVRDHKTARPQTIERAHECVLADRVVDDVDAAVLRRRFGLCDPVFARQHDVVCAELAGELRLCSSADHGDDFRAEMLRPLQQNRTDAADGGMHEQRVALAHAKGLSQQHLGSHAFQHESRSLVVADAFGNAYQPLGRQHACFAVCACGIECVGDAVAGLELTHTRADSFDDARRLATEYSGQLQRIQARALVGVDEVQSDRRVAHPRLALPGLRHIDLLPAQDFGTAVRMNSDRVRHARNRSVGRAL